MVGFLIQRLLQAAAVMLAMTVVVFFGVYAIGNPIDVLIMPGADQAMRAMLMERYGLDLPLWRQYLVFLGNLLHGDLGTSFQFSIPALQLILSRLPATMELAHRVAQQDSFALRLAKRSVNQTLDTMGFSAAIEHGFDLHHFGHARSLTIGDRPTTSGGISDMKAKNAAAAEQDAASKR